jgi:metal-responsive CopG/Arc/MetJ family transcriptional regulator
MCYQKSMTKQPKKPRGRPSLDGEPMQQIAIRLPAAMIRDVDAIVAGRDEGGRNAVVRELLREALAARKRKTK